MTTLLPLLEACAPRPPEQTSQDYAADLHRALDGEIGSAANAADFFASTYATAAMQRITAGIFQRLQTGPAADRPAVIRFNSRFGGGKTHTLIALAAAAKYPQLVSAASTGGLLAPELAVDNIKLVCYTGENADLLRGITLDAAGRRAKSLTGFLAYHLGGPAAYDDLKEYDEKFSDPGADALQRLIGDQPTLILIDELVRWVAVAAQLRDDQQANAGLRNALTALAKAVANSPRAVMVLTTPEAGHDAYQEETLAVQGVMNEINAILGRTSRDFTPTDDADFPAILRQRLFQSTGPEERRRAVAQAYAALARRENPADTAAETRFYDGYPFHPETLRIITERLASNNDFQRVRGALRALAAVLHHGDPIPEPLIHPYHLDVTVAAVREELVNRTGHSALDAAIAADVTGPTATAQRYGETARHAANTILLGSLAAAANRGLQETEIIHALASPAHPDASVARQAVAQIRENGLYIDDDPSAGALRFNQQANVRREVEQRANAVSSAEKEDGLRDAIYEAFARRDDALGVRLFPSQASNVPDDPNRVHLGIINPNHITMYSADRDRQLGRLYHHAPASNGEAPRQYKNNILFLVADHADLEEVKQQMARHRAAAEILAADAKNPQLQDHQRNTLETLRQSSHKMVYQGIQRNWVNLFYPQPQAQPLGLAPTRLQFPDQEGQGQKTIIDHLTSDTVGRMAHPRNPALSPAAWAAAGLAHAAGAGLTVPELHDRFARAPGRPMFRHRADFDKALDTASKEGTEQILIIRNPLGMEVKSGSGGGYKEELRVWLKDYAPRPAPPEPVPEPVSEPRPAVAIDEEPAPYRIPDFRSERDTGQVAVNGLKTRMAAEGLDWSRIAHATLYGAEAPFLAAMASKAQNCAAAVTVDYQFEANGFELRVTGKTAAEWQQCRRACEQMQRAAAADLINAAIHIAPEGDSLRNMLDDLDNTHQVELAVQFQQPDPPPGTDP